MYTSKSKESGREYNLIADFVNPSHLDSSTTRETNMQQGSQTTQSLLLKNFTSNKNTLSRTDRTSRSSEIISVERAKQSDPTGMPVLSMTGSSASHTLMIPRIAQQRTRKSISRTRRALQSDLPESMQSLTSRSKVAPPARSETVPQPVIEPYIGNSFLNSNFNLRGTEYL